MTWLAHHKASEAAAAAAHVARRNGQLDEARRLFATAAKEEFAALSFINSVEKPRTFGVTAVSAVALEYKAGELLQAERLAHSILADPAIPEFAIDQLRELLQTIWNEQAQASAGVSFVPGQVTLSVDGGEVVRGGAPLDLIVERVQTVQSLFYRTAEFLKQLPLRKHGPAPRNIQDHYRPWLFQSVPGSYQFTVAIQGPTQPDLFVDGMPEPSLVVAKFMAILESAATDPEQTLPEEVPDGDYRKTFLKLARNLAPTGRSFTQMEIRSSQLPSPVLLTQDSRKTMSRTIRSEGASKTLPATSERITLKGILRAVHLEEDWLELSLDDKLVRIKGVGETVDDVIGPMVNRRVVVQAERDAKGAYVFEDIESDDESGSPSAS
jgi:hypothetical protein